MKAIIEIRAGEGGKDSKLFVRDMFQMYVKYCQRNGISSRLLDETEGQLVLEAEGNIGNLVRWESGVHRVQRVPPTENHGRRQSSTITVAVIPVDAQEGSTLNRSDLSLSTYRGTGPGGQNRNKVETGIRAIHEPTGIMDCICTQRSQYQNKVLALSILAAKLKERTRSEQQTKEQAVRRSQIGKAGREEKIRTYNFIENRVQMRGSENLYTAWIK